jgi:hypothetical protein
MKRFRGLRDGALMRALAAALFAIPVAILVAAPGAGAATAAKRVTVTGELIDTWCYITEIMYAEGTAHHQCAVWCAVGGIPVSILGDDGNVYMVLKVEGDGVNVANPRIVTIQTHKVTVNGDLYLRDGVRYLVVTQVADDQGIVKLTHQEYGIQPFGK